MKDHTYTPNMPDNNGWKRRHLEAITQPAYQPTQFTHERSIALMLRGWLEYAQAHKERFESRIGDDYVLGDEWFAIGQALLGLLNGNLGRLDAGTLDTIIRDNLTEQGFDCDMGKRKD